MKGDFDGDGRDDIAAYSPEFIWTVRKSGGGDPVVMGWGQAGDIRVPGDYDGDGKIDITVWRPSTGQWYRQRSRAGLDIMTWGVPGDIPVPADYDGDGAADVAIFRPTNGTWYIIHSSMNHIILRQFGENGDIPTPGAFIC